VEEFTTSEMKSPFLSGFFKLSALRKKIVETHLKALAVSKQTIDRLSVTA
jgi:hypothetical protein